MTREPSRSSILFDPINAGLELEDREEPAFFPDLNLDQVFDAVAGSRREYKLAAFFRSPLSTATSVTYRQEVFRDIESGLAAGTAHFLPPMAWDRGTNLSGGASFLFVGTEAMLILPVMRSLTQVGMRSFNSARVCRASLGKAPARLCMTVCSTTEPSSFSTISPRVDSGYSKA